MQCGETRNKIRQNHGETPPLHPKSPLRLEETQNLSGESLLQVYTLVAFFKNCKIPGRSAPLGDPWSSLTCHQSLPIQRRPSLLGPAPIPNSILQSQNSHTLRRFTLNSLLHICSCISIKVDIDLECSVFLCTRVLVLWSKYYLSVFFIPFSWYLRFFSLLKDVCWLDWLFQKGRYIQGKDNEKRERKREGETWWMA